MSDHPQNRSPDDTTRAGMGSWRVFVLVAAGAVVGLAGTDLVLPAIPLLVDELAGTTTQAQWVLASYVTGTAMGLVLFGELGARYPLGRLLWSSLSGFAVVSLLAVLAESILQLTLLRFFQGLLAAAPAVFGPVILKGLFPPQQSLVYLGRLGSLESMAPALAPVIGAWLLLYFNWHASFYLLALAAVIVAVCWRVQPQILAGLAATQAGGSFLELMKNRRYLGYALSQAATLGALLTFVFAAPTLLTVVMGGDISDFIIMQVLGIIFFVLCANTAHLLVRRWGEDRTIWVGSLLAASGTWLLLAYAFLGGADKLAIWLLFVLVNAGLGVRGPPGFYKAIEAAAGDDARGSAGVVLTSLLTAAIGTVVVAPFIGAGLWPVSLVTAILASASPLLLWFWGPFSGGKAGGKSGVESGGKSREGAS